MVEQEQAPKKEEEQSMLSRDAKLILAFLLLNSIPIGYMNVVPLVYLVEIGYDPSIIGAIYGASAIANTVGLIPFGILADRYGRKNFLILGGILPCVSYAIFGLTLDPYWLVVASIIGGVGFAGGLAVAINSPPLLPLLAGSTSDKHRTTLFGVTQGVWTLALTVGAVLSFLPSFLVLSFGQSTTLAHSESYIFMSALVILSIIPLLFIHERRGALPVVESASPQFLERRTVLGRITSAQRSLPIVSGRKIAKFSIIFGFAGLGLGVIVQLLPTWYNLRFGVSEATAGLWVALAEVVSVGAIPIIPRLVKRGGTVIVATLTSLVSALFLALMPLSGMFQLVAVLFVVRNFFSTISWPVLQSYMMGVVAEKERASTVGITNTAWGVANSLGTFLGGALLGGGLLTLPFVIGVVGYVGSGVALLLFFKREKPPEEITQPHQNA